VDAREVDGTDCDDSGAGCNRCGRFRVELCAGAAEQAATEDFDGSGCDEVASCALGELPTAWNDLAERQL